MSSGPDHLHQHAHGSETRDWAEAGARLECEGDVAMPLLTAAIDGIVDAVGSPDVVVRVLDLGSGPGVAAVALAERFPAATVTSVDASPALLELARARAERFGVATRVRTVVADLEDSLDGVAPPGSVDVAWASMVLHHLEALPRALGAIHRALRPGGLLGVVELGGQLHGALPAGLDVGRDGFAERHNAAVRSALAAHLPPGALTLDWPALLADAGFECLLLRELDLHLPAPLDVAARECLLHDLQTSARRTSSDLGEDDRAVLAALVDVDDPRCVVRRDDVPLDLSRTFVLARRP